MINLLNATKIFGFEIDVDLNTLLIYFLLAQILICIITVIVVCVLIWRTRSKDEVRYVEEPKPKEIERTLLNISLDLTLVKQDFYVGEKFNCDGLVINATYNVEPLNESITNFAVYDQDKFKKLEKKNKLPNCYVVYPDMSLEGKDAVTVNCGSQSTVYVINIQKQEEIIEQAIETEAEDANKEESNEIIEVQEYFEEAEPVEEVPEEFVEEIKPVEEVPEEFVEEIEPVEEVPEEVVEEIKPVEEVSEEFVEEIKPIEEVLEEFVEQTEPVEEMKDDAGDEDFTSLLAENSDDSILRYDKSFEARLIQCGAEIKDWYSNIKNELLSYKKVHDRMSWKRETYSIGRQFFAKISFRGETLCLYLPLVPETIDDGKYKIENVSDNATYKDTPCLYRIKNKKRVKYAAELIAIVADLIGLEKTDHKSQDYVRPYEDDETLIKKGLIKYNIKDKEDEKFFEDRKAKNDAENSDD